MPFVRSVISIGVVLIAHFIGMMGIYWMYRWFDIPVHFLGGFAAGVLAIDVQRFVVTDLKTRVISPSVFSLIFVLGVTALIGVGWELHEYMLDQIRQISITRQPDLADTMLDLTMDLLGGAIAYVIFRTK